MASNQILHEFNLTYHVQSKHASSQGQAKVAFMVLMVLSKNKLFVVRDVGVSSSLLPAAKMATQKITTVPWAYKIHSDRWIFWNPAFWNRKIAR